MIHPAPKPAPRPKKQPRQPQRSPRPKPMNQKRAAREFRRAFGSSERVIWIQQQPCVWCGRTPSENAHTVTGGRGRREDAASIVPLCKGWNDERGIFHMGCHAKYDLHMAPFNTEEARAQVRACAAEIERLWQINIAGFGS